ncbi:MAG TPA: hypothetical protein VFN80_06080 [Acidothermaceae bacterium]|nr:hypothetical protein [Acidothermaceae bacterium]
MSEQFTDEISGGPQRPGHRAVAWATLAVLGAAAFGGGAYALTRGGGGGTPSTGAAAQLAAATTSPSPNSSAQPKPNDDQRRHGGIGGPMMRGPLGGLGVFGGPGAGGQLLHGESTVQTPDGKTQVVDMQRGAISSLDSGKKSVTVTSSDKVSFTYVTDANTRFIVFSASKPAQATFADLKQGDTVEIMAIRSGDTRTATSVVDGLPTAKDGKGWPGFGHRPGAPAPAPSTSASGASA